MDKKIEKLFDWLDLSTCNFRAVDTICRELDNAGFSELRQEDSWDIIPGSRHYVVKNGSAVFAFIAGTGKAGENGFRIISAHSDSPCFKIKPNAEMVGDGEWCALILKNMGAAFSTHGSTGLFLCPGG